MPVFLMRIFLRFKHQFLPATYYNINYNQMQEGFEMQDYLYENDIDKFPIAMAYVPWQKFDRMYDDLEKAYCAGTIFPELDKPFEGRRCV